MCTALRMQCHHSEEQAGSSNLLCMVPDQALADGLVSKLRMRPMGEYSMAWVTGVVGDVTEGQLPELHPAPAELEDADLDEAEDARGGIFIGKGLRQQAWACRSRSTAAPCVRPGGSTDHPAPHGCKVLLCSSHEGVCSPAT